MEICRGVSSGGDAVPLTHLANDDLLNQYQLTSLEDFWVAGAVEKRRRSRELFIVKPPDFNPVARKYPAILLVHGGPESEWGESWTHRWNAQVFAGAGYVVGRCQIRADRSAMGRSSRMKSISTGACKPYDDLMAVTDYVAKLPYVRFADRIAAAGGSYGGYMIDWMLGHTNRFKCFISHDGVYDLRSEAESTEELWFPIWEFGGMPWDNPEVYDKWSPSHFVKEFQTPTLVIHGELDFRVPVRAGPGALHRPPDAQGSARSCSFSPMKRHWVLKPQNSALWYKTFISWIDNWTKK